MHEIIIDRLENSEVLRNWVLTNNIIVNLKTDTAQNIIDRVIEKWDELSVDDKYTVSMMMGGKLSIGSTISWFNGVKYGRNNV